MKNICFFAVVVIAVSLWLVGCRQQPTADSTPNPTLTPEATATSQPMPTPVYEPVFETADCQFSYSGDADIHCGYLVVPEDRSEPERMVRLHVAVVSSSSSSPAPDPLVYLDGGPGGYTLAVAGNYLASFRDVLKERDVIFFDQRGIGYSEPSLDCPELDESVLAHIEERLDDDEKLANTLEALTACRDRLLAEGVNLSAYNSAASSADLDDLRRALGYESWNLYGISYGTRLALTAMRDYGDTGTIRSVVLDSVYPPQIDGFGVLGVNADRAFTLMFERCAAIEQCNGDYPDLENRFYDLVDALNEEPMTVVVTDRASRTNYRIPVDGDDLIDVLFLMMYDGDQVLYVPRMIAQVERRVSSILMERLGLQINVPAYSSEGMQLSVQCFEEAPFYKGEVEGESLPPELAKFYGRWASDLRTACELWGVKSAEPLENEPVVSDIPTLILSGDYDPITPPSNGMETAEFLSNSFFFEFEGVGHGVAMGTNCGMDMITAFLEKPDVRPDDGCMTSLFVGFVRPY
ncbi:MAG: alpha/beta fold hydrolase [Candidatus Promineifilaceae bacterium]